MMMQLVVFGCGVCCLLNWVLYEYSLCGYVMVWCFGEKGLYCMFFVVICMDMFDVLFMCDFLFIVKDIFFVIFEGVSVVKG